MANNGKNVKSGEPIKKPGRPNGGIGSSGPNGNSK